MDAVAKWYPLKWERFKGACTEEAYVILRGMLHSQKRHFLTNNYILNENAALFTRTGDCWA